MSEVTIDCPFGEEDDCNIKLTIQREHDSGWYIVAGEHHHTKDMNPAKEREIDRILEDKDNAAYEDDIDRRIDDMREREFDR